MAELTGDVVMSTQHLAVDDDAHADAFAGAGFFVFRQDLLDALAKLGDQTINLFSALASKKLSGLREEIIEHNEPERVGRIDQSEIY